MEEGMGLAPNVGRGGRWMQMFSGLAYWPLDPRADEVSIIDIAHSLAHLCRYGGHCDRFYSVAEHSVLVSKMVPPRHAFAGLMHDATEAYVTDVPRPLKYELAGYKEIEARNWAAIALAFALPYELPQCVHDADNDILLTEQAQLMKPAPIPWSVTGTAADFKLDCLSPKDAEARFLATFYKLQSRQYREAA